MEGRRKAKGNLFTLRNWCLNWKPRSEKEPAIGRTEWEWAFPARWTEVQRSRGRKELGLFVGWSRKGTHVADVVWGGESSGYQLEFYFKEIKELKGFKQGSDQIRWHFSEDLSSWLREQGLRKQECKCTSDLEQDLRARLETGQAK